MPSAFRVPRACIYYNIIRSHFGSSNFSDTCGNKNEGHKLSAASSATSPSTASSATGSSAASSSTGQLVLYYSQSRRWKTLSPGNKSCFLISGECCRSKYLARPRRRRTGSMQTQPDEYGRRCRRPVDLGGSSQAGCCVFAWKACSTSVAIMVLRDYTVHKKYAIAYICIHIFVSTRMHKVDSSEPIPFRPR